MAQFEFLRFWCLRYCCRFELHLARRNFLPKCDWRQTHWCYRQEKSSCWGREKHGKTVTAGKRGWELLVAGVVPLIFVHSPFLDF